MPHTPSLSCHAGCQSHRVAEVQAYIGPPSEAARYTILRSCVAELRRAGIVAATSAVPPSWELAAAHADAMQASRQAGANNGGLTYGAAGLHSGGGSVQARAVGVRASSAPADGPQAMDVAQHCIPQIDGVASPAAMLLEGALGAAHAAGVRHGSTLGLQDGGGQQGGEHGAPVTVASLQQLPMPQAVREELNGLHDGDGALIMGSLLRCAHIHILGSAITACGSNAAY